MRAFGAVLVSIALISSCGGAERGDSVAPAPTTLADTSPGHLDVFLNISMGGYDVGSRGRALVDVSFSAGGRPVNFVAGESIVCDGDALKAYTGSFEMTLSVANLSGRALTCVYKWPSGSAPITFTGPNQLAILSPREGNPVARAAGTTIEFDAASGAPPTVVALTSDSKAYAQPGQISSGAATFDTRGLHPGKGSISLTQNVDLADFKATGFHSGSGRATLMTMIEVTWL